MEVPCVAGVLVLALPAVMWAQPAAIQIKVVEGEGAAYAPGSRAAKPLTVEVTDGTGHPVPGAAVTFHFPEQGPSGLFLNGLRTDLVLTDAYGRAAVRGFQLNRVGGTVHIRITALKDQVRAGIVANQSIVEAGTAAATAQPAATTQPVTTAAAPGRSAQTVTIERTTVRPAEMKIGHPGRKWFFVTLLAAGAAAGGAFARVRASESPASSTGSPAGVPAAVQTLSVGTPIVTIVHP